MRNTTLLVLSIGMLVSLSARAAAEELEFNRDIRPILSQNCFLCHGFDESTRQADLRLDEAESALDERGGMPAIVPGKPEQSEVWRRITSDEAWEVMPPVDSHLSLTEAQKETLRKWIEQGAAYADHWSFVRPEKAEPPEVSDDRWPRNPIDRFVLRRLDAAGLSPSAEADRRTLARRLALDLTGLPPTGAEVEAFAADGRPDAYERLVDRLLGSAHFGERMALDWLDAARYADTNGYSIDGGRHMWLWRDWVIDAYNRNVPYDQFLREQIAGDLLPEPTDAQLIATGFQRNNMNTHEGGTIPEENLTNYNVDRVKTLGEAVLGLTLGCAQCHDHKYDPITQRDFFQLFAYFNTLSDVGLDGNHGVNSRPVYEARTVLNTGEEPALQRRIEQLRRQLANPPPADMAAWESEQRALLSARGAGLQLHAVELLNVSTPNAGAGFDIDPPRFVHISRADRLVAYDVSLRLPSLDEPITGLRVVFHPDAEAPNAGRGHGTLAPESDTGEAAEGTFVLTTLSVSAEPVPGDQVNLHELRAASQVTANTWRSDFRPEHVLDTRNENGWSPGVEAEGPVHLTMTFDRPIDSASAPYLTAQLNFGHGDRLVAARFELLAMTGADDGAALPEEIVAIVETPRADRSSDERERLREYFAAHSEATRAARIELANLEERLAVLTRPFPTMIMDVAEEPRETYILHRGDYSQPTEKVAAGTPAVLPPLPEGAPANRLGLAEWVTMREHPLTARTYVNRVWQMLFGIGIVQTTADLGAQGEYPSHPELLDWLAVDFMEHGWNVKRLVRQIVTSATYRQTSTAPGSAGGSLLARDPQNRLLARGPRFRLPAEFIRDSALKVSGLLVDRLGGPSVHPYSPGDLWREISHYGSTPATAQTFVQDHGEKLYRRSLYTYWKRTAPPPNLAVFDAPNRETCVVWRPTTTTPLQALVLLNDVQFVEASRAFAERIIVCSEDDVQRLRWAFAECISRLPTDEEFAVLTSALERERERYAANESLARAYLANGESPRDKSIPAAEHAAWSQIAALLLNLSETVTRN